MKDLKRKDLLLLATKLAGKITDSCNAKEHYQSFIRNINAKSEKQSKIITYPPKTFENSNVVHVKSAIIEHPETSHTLSKAIRQAEKFFQVGSKSCLYSDTKKVKIFRRKKNVRITQPAHAFKGYVSSYNVKILNSFNPELQLKDTKSTIKKANRSIDLIKRF